MGIDINKRIFIVSDILLSVHNELNTHVLMINGNKTFYEHDSLSTLFNSLSRDLNERLDIH